MRYLWYRSPDRGTTSEHAYIPMYARRWIVTCISSIETCLGHYGICCGLGINILIASWPSTVRVREQQWRGAKCRTKHGLAWPAVLGFSTATGGDNNVCGATRTHERLARQTRSRPRSRVYHFGPAIAYPGRQTGMFWGLAWEIVHHRSQSTAVPLSNLQKAHGYRAADFCAKPLLACTPQSGPVHEFNNNEPAVWRCLQ